MAIELTGLTQSHLDIWLTQAKASQRRANAAFIGWTNKRSLTQNLEYPGHDDHVGALPRRGGARGPAPSMRRIPHCRGRGRGVLRGPVIEADLVLVGAGSLPNVELAQEAGLRIDRGVLTDEHSRTSAPDVYAAGGVAAAFHPHYSEHIRVEHHDSAVRHGASAARNMLGLDDPFLETHWFWSDQYDHSIQQVGRARPDDEVVVRGSLDDLSFSAFSLRDGRITRVISLNRPKDVLAVRRLLFTEHAVTAAQLRDEATQLNRLAPRKSPPRAEA
ncbi:oxidoreductase C-terminal domain-containing protein [Streptomyces sp. NPDC055140]